MFETLPRCDATFFPTVSFFTAFGDQQIASVDFHFRAVSEWCLLKKKKVKLYTQRRLMLVKEKSYTCALNSFAHYFQVCLLLFFRIYFKLIKKKQKHFLVIEGGFAC